MKPTETWTAEQAREHFRKPTQPHKPKKKVTSPALFHIEVILIDMGVQFVKEHKFHPTRKWRFDFALVDKKVAVEYEGIYGTGKSRHTTKTGYTADTEKYNAAAAMGWKVLRYTAKGYGKLMEDLKPLL